MNSTKQLASNKLHVILRRPRTLVRGRLEGWPQTPSLPPSFETLVASRRAPQDDVEFVSREMHDQLRLCTTAAAAP
jgi:hypothetical protein